ncbi:MAG: hypothetical protein DRN04_06695 [Thermoprotei archaeon]|nr:MAG: hypothetical protein DRN04_06695 [Thermoprotei archaeon]
MKKIKCTKNSNIVAMLIEEIVASVLARVEDFQLSLRGVIDDFFRKYPNLAQLRSVVTAFSLAVLRRYRELDLIAEYELSVSPEEISAYDRNLIRAFTYEARYRDISLRKIARGLRRAGIEVSLSEVRKLRSADLSEYLKTLPPLEKLAVKYSQPTWVVEYLSKILKEEELVELLDIFNKPSVLWIRVNTLKINVKELKNKLMKRGVIVEEDNDLNDILKVIKGSNRLPHIPEYYQGLFYIQDKASALVAHEIKARKGEVVVDLCSAPGGKATHIVQLSKAYVIGLDISFRRIFSEKKLSKNLSAYHFLDLCISDAKIPPLRKADKVLVDPDCSALGKLGHSPEIRLWIKQEHVEKYSLLQRAILEEAAKLVKKNGEIVYSTCTLTLEENEQNVKAIAEKYDMDFMELEHKIGDSGIDLPSALRLYPHKHGTQGFFIVKLYK